MNTPTAGYIHTREGAGQDRPADKRGPGGLGADDNHPHLIRLWKGSNAQKVSAG